MSDEAFVYRNVKSLNNSKKVSTGSCASLVQWYTKAGLTSTWREGIKVRGNGDKILPGTAVATFENGVYPNRPKDNHAALYVSQDSQAVWVIDQWKGKDKITMRPMRFKGKNSDGSYLDPSNNGDALSVITHE
jgi:hypothetical protein